MGPSHLLKVLAERWVFAEYGAVNGNGRATKSEFHGPHDAPLESSTPDVNDNSYASGS